MRGHASMSKIFTVIMVVAALALPAENAWAGSKVFSPFGVIRTISGSVETNQNLNRDPFVLQVFSAGNECLKLTVTSQGADLEATLVAPGGRVWQDDDSGGSLRPRIHAQTTVRGWHTLALSHFTGASVNADFTMTILRQATSSCVPVTTPRILLEPQSGKQGTVGAGPQGGANE